jgi:benzodiazapine receptor
MTQRDTHQWPKAIKNLAKLIFCLGLAHGAGLIGLLTGGSPNHWYETLVKPPGTPPGFVFGIVWPVLYTMMGFALFLFVRRAQGRERRNGLVAFAVQWGLNAAWTPLFFYWQWPLFALLDIIALLVIAGFMIMWFNRISRPAAALLIPYVAWILYAGYLNAGFVWLN